MMRGGSGARRWAGRLLLSLLSALFALVSVGVAVEVYQVIVRGSRTGSYDYNDQLGWAPRPTSAVSTNEFGFRAWGDLDSERPRILFIGDSFTADTSVSDSQAYFGVVGGLLPLEVFAIGGSGYGTLQELLTLRQYGGIIRPQIVVLQFCTNDLLNNSLELESASIARNQKYLRPYSDGHSTVRRQGIAVPYRWLFTNSGAFRYVDSLITAYQHRRLGGYYPPDYLTRPSTLQLMDDARQVTAKLLVEFAAEVRALDAQGVSFNCRAGDPVWEELSAAAGVTPVPSVAAAVEGAEATGVVVRGADGGHWNAVGHRYAGRALAAFLSDKISPGTAVPGHRPR